MSAFRSDLVDKCWRQDWNGLTDCLSQGHPVNQVDCNGFTSLQVCAALGWTSALSVLLKYGADVHARSPLGWTALMQAVRNGHRDAAEVLLDAGANVLDKNSLGWDVISLAVASNDDSLLMKLIQQTKESHLSSALLIACQIGNVNAVNILIEEEVDINYKVPISELTPLMLAAAEGHERVVEILLHHKANPHAMNSYNLTASDVALMNRKHTVVDMLSHHMKPQVPLKHNLLFTPHYLYIPQLPDKPVSPSPHNQMKFYLPMHPSPVVGPTSPQIFLYPPPQNPIHSPYLNPIGFEGTSPFNSFPYSPVYLVPPSCQCNSPCASSPLIPAWMFSPWQKKYKKEHMSTGKAPKFLKKWWSRLKRRCNGKMHRKKFRLHMTHGKGSEVTTSERKLEEVLSVLNLNYLAPLLKSHEIDLETFTQLRDKDLEELGIADTALQLSILQKISSLKSNLTVGAFKS